ncbi:MAG: hypothetical protein FJX54_18855 [Alphaproteobacteria bacterium]|nr:hypothetical protein [Alphaproteobacteria bacterium]
MRAVLLLVVLTTMALPASAQNAFTQRCEADMAAKASDPVLAQRSCACMRKYLATTLGQSGHDRVLAALEAASWAADRARLSADERQTVGSARIACGV